MWQVPFVMIHFGRISMPQVQSPAGSVPHGEETPETHPVVVVSVQVKEPPSAPSGAVSLPKLKTKKPPTDHPALWDSVLVYVNVLPVLV